MGKQWGSSLLCSILAPKPGIQCPPQDRRPARAVVKEYLYLGVTITQSLEIKDLLAPCLALGRKTVYSLAPFLWCQVIPLSDWLQAVQGVVLPRLLYGV
jgi:hypothetical protein